MLSARQIRGLLMVLALIGAVFPNWAAAQRRLSLHRARAAQAPIGLGALAHPRPLGQTPHAPVVRPVHGSIVEEMPSADHHLLDELAGENVWNESNIVGVHDDCDGCNECGPSAPIGSWIDHFSLYGGTHAFKNDANRGADGSFGFHYGLNFGTAAKNIILPPSMGWQLGVQFANSNLNAASFTADERSQVFLTTGVYRRGDYGLQGGLVFDYLWDDWYFAEKVSVGQVRGEVGLATTPATTLGFQFAASVSDHTTASQTFDSLETERWRTKDQFRFFYRTRLFGGGRGEGELYAGFSGHSDGIIGGKSKMPLHNGWAIETDYTYLIPGESKQNGANENESWNISLNLVWYPGSLACGSCNRYHRPIFDVANNGSMILRREAE